MESLSFVELKASLSAGPTGVDGARAIIADFARHGSDDLDLQQMGLTDADLREVMDDILAVAQQIKVLNLFMNELTVLPAEINACAELEKLLVGCNPLIEIDENLFEGLRKLKEIDIGYGEALEKIPESVGLLRSLRKLEAGNCRIKELPAGIFRCEELEELHLFGNCIKEVPEGIGRLKRLKLLNMGRNQITSLPAALASLPVLEMLYVYENNLKDLPNGLSDLPNLKALNVDANCELPLLPAEIRRTGSPKAVAAFYAGS